MDAEIIRCGLLGISVENAGFSCPGAPIPLGKGAGPKPRAFQIGSVAHLVREV